MSVMYCDFHGHWDSDYFENCQACDVIGRCAWCGHHLRDADEASVKDDQGRIVCGFCAAHYRDNCDTPGDVRDYT